MKPLDDNRSAKPTSLATTADVLVTNWLNEYAGHKAVQMLTTANQQQLRDALHRIVSGHDDVNVDEEDIRAVLTKAVSLQVGRATASGLNRAEKLSHEIWNKAILIGEATLPAHSILLAIQSGTVQEFEMDELTQILEYITAQAGSQAEIIFGHGVDAALGASVEAILLVGRR